MKRDAHCGVLGLRLVDEAGNGNSSARDFPNAFRSFAIQTGLKRHSSDDLARAGGADFVNCDWVTGCFYLVRRTTIEEVGLFDPRYFLYFEEVDHCRSVKRAGWTVHCLLNCTAVHEGGASARSEGGQLTTDERLVLNLMVESELLYFRKHDGLLGLSLTLALGLATDAVVFMKSILRSHSRQNSRGHTFRTGQLCRLAVATRGGLHPTR
jgi:GT2 family glycosyltransferase